VKEPENNFYAATLVFTKPFLRQLIPIKKSRLKLAAKTIKTAPKDHANTARNLGLKVSESEASN